jgi:hypothetical protein
MRALIFVNAIIIIIIIIIIPTRKIHNFTTFGCSLTTALREGAYSRRFQIFWEAAVLEQGPLSLVRTTEELLEGKVAAPV